MKIEKLQSTFPRITKAIENYRYTKHKAELDSLVDLSGAYNDAHIQLINAQEGLANYAKAKNVRISFNNMLMERSMNITITNKEGKQANAVINSKTDEIETIERPIKRILENKDGTNYQAMGTESHEDNFLRRVYRTVETLTNSFK